ncbi:MAG: hypothetical protein HYZ18_13225 [Pseudogulbenkiania sp.]|nr:hypothetical protein [Pseudogulbenkiania sp.]
MALSFVATAEAGGKAGRIPTWTASPQPAWSSELPIPLGLPNNRYLQTVRQVARVSMGGTKVRIVISNAYGKVPSAILADAPSNARAIVAFGDSITDVDGSTVDGNDRWPDHLAKRLIDAGGQPVAILNQGISGARLLYTLMGENALARFERDVLSQPDVDTVVLMMGINDKGDHLHPNKPGYEAMAASINLKLLAEP